MNKSKKIIIAMISVLTAVALFLIGAMSVVIATDGKIFDKLNIKYKEPQTVIFEQSYDLKEFNSLILDTSVADVTFKKSNDANLKVTAYGRKDNKFSSKIKNKVLMLDETYGTVTLSPNWHGKGINLHGIKIVIALPENFNYPINADIDTGDMDFQIPYASKLKAQLDTGDFQAVELGGKFDVSTDTGDVSIKNAHPATDSKIEVDLGDITIDSVENANIEYETDLGDTNIKKNNKNSNVTLSLCADTGDINVNN